MRPSTRAGPRARAALAALLLLAPLPAAAQRTGTLSIAGAWTRPTPPGAPTAAGYLSVTNHGKAAERLLGGTSPRVGAIEPHTMSMTGNIMRMRPLPNGYAIAPGSTLTLSPAGDHLMLIGVKRPFKVAERVPVTLRFEHAGAVTVEFEVRTEPPK